jgi:hypothetical protein
VRDLEAEPAQHGAALQVGEAHVLETQPVVERRQLARSGLLHHVRARIEQGEDPARGRDPLLDLRVDLGQAFHRGDRREQGGHEHEELLRLDGVRDEDLAPPRPQHGGRHQDDGEFTQRTRSAAHAPKMHEGTKVALVGHLELALLDILASERLDHPHAADVLLQDPGEIRHALLRARGALAHLAPEHDQGPENGRDDEQRPQREPP